jgi:hypothetical protein
VCMLVAAHVPLASEADDIAVARQDIGEHGLTFSGTGGFTWSDGRIAIPQPFVANPCCCPMPLGFRMLYNLWGRPPGLRGAPGTALR